MNSYRTFTEIAALAGDPGRASMLHAMLDGRALTASELAKVAGITPQTASGHLARLTSVGLVTVEKQGRHRYHRLASPAVAQMMEGIMQVACDLAHNRNSVSVDPKEAALRAARICYDHLAGQLGVALADALVGAEYAELSPEGGLLTRRGLQFLSRIGVKTVVVTVNGTPSKRILCRPCLDWTERRTHIGGAIGAAMCSHSLERGWLCRSEHSRAVLVTPRGRLAFRQYFGIQLT
jgi:DNA-binding transcriptional ArsR family regulator